MTEANQNFSKVARQIENEGNVVILKNNKPRYLIFDINKLRDDFNLKEFLKDIK